MIAHFVFAKLKDPEVARRQQVAAHAHEQLRGVEEAVMVAVGLPADDSAARWDLALELRFASLEAYRRVAATARWQAFFHTWLADRCVVVKAWNFELHDDPSAR
jgi:hypothetical protein